MTPNDDEAELSVVFLHGNSATRATKLKIGMTKLTGGGVSSKGFLGRDRMEWMRSRMNTYRQVIGERVLGLQSTIWI